VDLSACHGFTEAACGVGGGGDEDDSAGFAVEAVDDGELAAVAQFVGAEVFEVVEEGAGSAGFAGVDEEVSGFVEDEEVIAFVEDAQRGGFQGVHGRQVAQLSGYLDGGLDHGGNVVEMWVKTTGWIGLWGCGAFCGDGEEHVLLFVEGGGGEIA